MIMTRDDLLLIARTIRLMAMDGVEKAASGHPGMPMGCADMAAVLWGKILKHNPDDPAWPNRDRFILSAGHGSMLLYTMLHLSGYELSLDDLRQFRQMNSKTPGHPEFHHTPGVETTTGPLGQGFANGVGMAYASRLLAAEFNTPGNEIIDHCIYAIVSDGDLMEGISSEAASLAGHWGLGNIVYLYDSNDISIEGSTELAFTEDVATRFAAYNWHVQTIDGHDHDQIEKALIAGRKETLRPSIIIAKTRIAKGSATKEGSEESHGAPLGADDVRESKQKMGCDPDATFCVSNNVYDIFSGRKAELHKEYSRWQKLFQETISGDVKKRWDSFFRIPDIDNLRAAVPQFDPSKKVATRSAGGTVMAGLYKNVPNFMGGSADLGPSNKTFVKGYSQSGRNAVGRSVHFGVREHAMGSIQNGIAYYGGFIPFSATFFVFMDYMRPAIRIAALAGLHTIYVFTHDSFFVGEDGPTHQPVEHLASARAIPNLTVIRPADGPETVEAWLYAIKHDSGPTMLALSRQDLPVITAASCSLLWKGAYVLHEPASAPDIIVYASGSEVHISVAAAAVLAKEGIHARVVSFPSWEIFDQQDEAYRKTILAPGIPKAVVEAALSQGWERYAGYDPLRITMENYGMSAPAGTLAEHFGFTPDKIAARIRKYLGR